MNKEIENKIEKIILEFFEKMGIEENPEEFEITEDTVSFKIKSNEPEVLIGKRGKTLTRIQSLLAKIINKQTGSKFFINFDVNDYKKRKIDYLEEIAKETAEEVTLSKEEKILPPMTPFERRIIHITLSENTSVITESEGNEPERKVVIKPR